MPGGYSGRDIRSGLSRSLLPAHQIGQPFAAFRGRSLRDGKLHATPGQKHGADDVFERSAIRTQQ